jgi:predicted transcriptional regulator YdeE
VIFKGIGKTFSTENEQQYETIGAFWDELSAQYGLENLQGLGYGWTDCSIEYVIGLKSGEIEGANRSIELPDDGWTSVKGRTEHLGQIYDEIYKDGSLKYEIETFTEQGDCEILYCR